MHPTLAQMQQHHSVRSYQSRPVEPALLDAILDAAWKGPTSINGQQVSLVVIQDAARRARIAEIAGGQPWIAQAPVFITVLIDFHKTAVAAEKAGLTQAIHRSVEGFAVGAVDAGIALGNLMTAARAAGLGVVPIGGIRRDPEAMVRLLDLPPQTFPVAGLALGYIDQDGSVKPRLPRQSFVHHETYSQAAILPAIETYDQTLQAYWQQIGRADGQAWSANTAQTYQTVYFPLTAVVARQQGFDFEH